MTDEPSLAHDAVFIAAPIRQQWASKGYFNLKLA